MITKLEQKRKKKDDWLASLISKKFNKQQKESVKALELLSKLNDDK